MISGTEEFAGTAQFIAAKELRSDFEKDVVPEASGEAGRNPETTI